VKPSCELPRPRGPKTQKIDPAQILGAAQALFSREGVQGASVRAIAREAGCDASLIYYHFENKEAIFTALLARKFPLLQQELERIADSADGRHTALRLWEVLQAYHSHLVDDAGFRAIVRGEIVRGAEGIQDLLTQRIAPVIQALSNLMQQGVQRGHIRPGLPPMLLVFFLVRLEFEILDLIPVMAQRLAAMPAEDALPLAERCWFEVFWRGIATHPEEPLPFHPQGASA